MCILINKEVLHGNWLCLHLHSCVEYVFHFCLLVISQCVNSTKLILAVELYGLGSFEQAHVFSDNVELCLFVCCRSLRNLPKLFAKTCLNLFAFALCLLSQI